VELLVTLTLRDQQPGVDLARGHRDPQHRRVVGERRDVRDHEASRRGDALAHVGDRGVQLGVGQT